MLGGFFRPFRCIIKVADNILSATFCMVIGLFHDIEKFNFEDES